MENNACHSKFIDSILKSRDITLQTKVHLVKAMVFPVVMYGCKSWAIKKTNAEELMLLNCGTGEDSWESLGLQGDQTSQSYRRWALNIHWKDWCWSWNSNTLATWCKEPNYWKRPWYSDRLKAGREGDDRVWDGWMASLTNGYEFHRLQALGWTGKPGVLLSIGAQRAGHNWATELNWTDNTSDEK